MAVAATNKSAVLTAVLLLALALSGAGAGAPSPSATVEFSNEYYNPLDFDCYKGGAADGVAPGKSFSFEIHNLKYKNENAYICNIYDDTVATLQSRGYDRVRDRGHLSVYWKINTDGLYRSYDKTHWIFDTEWSSID